MSQRKIIPKKKLLSEKNYNNKLSETQFLSFLRANGGLYARTAREIKNQLGIDITRQAVRQRAENFPAELYDIEEENLDLAEEKLKYFLNPPPGSMIPWIIQFKAAELLLKTKGKKRGYIEKAEVEHTGTINITQSHYRLPDGTIIEI